MRPLVLSAGYMGQHDWFLWQMLNERMPSVTLEKYQSTFERGSTRDKVNTAGRTVLLLGEAACAAFLTDWIDIVHPIHKTDGTVFRWIYLPSSEWYNDEVNRIIVGMLLEDLYVNHG